MGNRSIWPELVALAVVLGACQVVAPAAPTRAVLSSTLTPPAVTAPPTTALPPSTAAPATRSKSSVSQSNQRVEIALYGDEGKTAITAPVGQVVRLTIDFRPTLDVITQWTDGSKTSYSEGWLPNPIAEMRICSGIGRTCGLPDKWVAYADDLQVDVPIDWVGLRDYRVTAQFRDSSGKIIPAGVRAEALASQWVPIIGEVDARTPIASQPPAIQTVIRQSQSAFPVTGRIQVGDQKVIGDKAGGKIDVTVLFEAASPLAPVREMRVKSNSIGRCLTPEEMSDSPWVPFATRQVHTVTVALNWTTFKLHVQYRDEKGNVSPVYCGEVAIEGHP